MGSEIGQGEAVTPPQEFKRDAGKVDYTYILGDLQRAAEEVCKVFEFGANKYARGSWVNVEDDRYRKATLRHIVSDLKGDYKDDESGLDHLAHAVCSLMFILERRLGDGK